MIPPKTFKLGAAVATWEEFDPGFAKISVTGGDSYLAYAVLRSDLEGAGYIVPEFELTGSIMQKTAQHPYWDDAAEMVQNGNVTLLRNGYTDVVATVMGRDPSSGKEPGSSEHKPQQQYQVELTRNDPSSRAIASWHCTCPWGSNFAWNRSRNFKRFEGRTCVHALATYWKSISSPLDEDIHPATSYGVTPQQRAFDPGQSPPGTVTYPGQGMMGDLPQIGQTPNSPGQIPGITPGVGQPIQQPSQANPLITPPVDPSQISLIPPQQGDYQWPVSTPSNLGPYPQNPLQQRGTLSYFVHSDVQFQNGDVVKVTEPVLGQSEGREGAYDAGQWMEISPTSGPGEVLGQDPITGWVDCIFPLSGGAMSSYHVRVIVEPEKLSIVQRTPPVTPFTRRRDQQL